MFIKRKKMNIKILLLSLVLPVTAYAHDSKRPPELWSWFKDMNKSSEACMIQSSFILDKIGIENITHNDYGVYGTYKSNRIVIKCLPKDKKSLLWVAVAGSDKDSVEIIRNKIVSDVS